MSKGIPNARQSSIFRSSPLNLWSWSNPQRIITFYHEFKTKTKPCFYRKRINEKIIEEDLICWSPSAKNKVRWKVSSCIIFYTQNHHPKSLQNKKIQKNADEIPQLRHCFSGFTRRSKPEPIFTGFTSLNKI